MGHSANVESPAPLRTSIEDLQLPLDRLEHFILSLKSMYKFDSSKIYGVGFSQGAALLSSLSLLRPGMFSKIALLSGYIPSAIVEKTEGTQYDSLPDYFISHGTKDKIIPHEKAHVAQKTLQSLGASVTLVTEEVGHKTGSSAMKALGAWWEK